jgi:hypothetical protein
MTAIVMPIPKMMTRASGERSELKNARLQSNKGGLGELPCGNPFVTNDLPKVRFEAAYQANRRALASAEGSNLSDCGSIEDFKATNADTRSQFLLSLDTVWLPITWRPKPHLMPLPVLASHWQLRQPAEERPPAGCPPWDPTSHRATSTRFPVSPSSTRTGPFHRT